MANQPKNGKNKDKKRRIRGFLDVRKKATMMAVVCRNHVVFDKVRPLFSLDEADGIGGCYAVIYKCVGDFYDQHGEMPGKTLLKDSVQQFIADSPEELADDEVDRLDAFVDMIFDESEWDGQSLATSKKYAKQALQTFAQFTEERVALQAQQLILGKHVAADVQGKLAEALERLDKAKSLTLDNKANEWTFDELMAAEVPPVEWLIPHLIQKGKNCLLSGASKTCKTQIALEASLGLASGNGNVLGEHWGAIEPVRVLYYSGEADQGALKHHLGAMARRQGITTATNLKVIAGVPQIHDPESMASYAAKIKAHQARVVFIDCMYLTGIDSDGDNSANVNKMGPILAKLEDATRQAGADTLVMLHHVTKTAVRNSKPGELPDLMDVAYSGFSERARQWILLKRNRPYRKGRPDRLWCVVGGSSSHPGHEAELTIDRTGGAWKVTTKTVDQARKDNKGENKKEADPSSAGSSSTEFLRIKDAVLGALDLGPKSKRKLADAAGVHHTSHTLDAVLDHLVEQQVIVLNDKKKYQKGPSE
jgi:hypothetical protein